MFPVNVKNTNAGNTKKRKRFGNQHDSEPQSKINREKYVQRNGAGKPSHVIKQSGNIANQTLFVPPLMSMDVLVHVPPPLMLQTVNVPSAHSHLPPLVVQSEMWNLHNMTTLEKDPVKRSNQVILHYFNTTKQGQAEYGQKLELVERVYGRLAKLYPGCGLYLVGSSVNGFGEKDSDIDLCLMISSHEVSRNEALSILRKIQTVIEKLPDVRNTTLIKATVPILDFRDLKSGKECDMNINNKTGIRNSHLLACYCNFDDRVAPLVLFLKRWARFHKINSAKDNTLSSYVITLMAIHFLQYGVSNRPVLPNLQAIYPECFPEDIKQLRMDVIFRPFPAEERNTMTVSELLTDFFRYYNSDFRFEVDVACVRTGRREHIQKILNHQRISSQNLNNNVGQVHQKCTWMDAKLLVEEPFDRKNAARCVFDQFAFMKVKRVFRRSYERLKQTKDVNEIISHPF